MRFVHRFEFAAAVLSALALALGLAVVIGWRLNLQSGGDPTLRWRNASPTTAVLIVVLASAARLLRDREQRNRCRTARWLALGAGAVGVLVLSEKWFGGGPYIQSRVLRTFFPATAASHPQMSSYTAMCVVVQSIALLLVDSRSDSKHCPGQWLCLFPFAASLLVLIGHSYGVPWISQTGTFTVMAIPAALGLMFISLAIACSRPDREPVSLFAGDDAGGYVARRVVPAAIIFPIVAGCLQVAGHQAGLYGPELGIALFAIANVLFFALLTASIAAALRTLDCQRSESHALLQGVISETTDFIAVVDPSFRYVAINEAHRREYKALYGVDVAVGRSVLDALIHVPEDYRAAREAWERAFRGEPFAVVNRCGAPERICRWHEITCSPIRNVKGDVIAAAQIGRDMTERREAEEALRLARDAAERSRAQQEAVVRSMAEGVAVFDPAGNLVDANPAALTILGYASLDAMREHVIRGPEGFDLRYSDGRPVPVEEWPISRALRGETFTGYELHVRRGNTGPYIVACFGGGPVRDSDGRIILAVSTLRDATKQREAEQQLESAKRQLEQHMHDLEGIVAERTAKLTETVNELERFSYSLSHDLRAPLRAMKGYSQILQAHFGERLAEEGAIYLNRISEAAGRLDQLIQDVLAYSRIVREQVKLEPVNVERMLRQMIEESPALQPPNASVTIDSPLLPVLGHEAYLMQVLSNLLYNAVKFVAPGVEPRVHIRSERLDGHVRLYVRDNGIGIAKEAQVRLFGMFERVNTHYEGTGIGLSIVRKAVERMGGEVGVESAEGEGATFWVQLREPNAS